jgi:hypothetical protein
MKYTKEDQELIKILKNEPHNLNDEQIENLDKRFKIFTYDSTKSLEEIGQEIKKKFDNLNIKRLQTRSITLRKTNKKKYHLKKYL